MSSITYLLKEGIKGLWKNRTMSFASVIVLVSCLILTGIAVLISLNMDSAMRSLESENSITVFLDEDLPQLKAIQIGEQIRTVDNINSVEFVNSEDALMNILETLEDDGTVFSELANEENFLPDAYTISMAELDVYDQTIADIEAIEGVDYCTDYSVIADTLNDLDTLIRYGSIAIVAILGIVALFIISNTVKVTMFSRRVEISIMKSVGATNLFIRIPFIVEGLIIGLISGAISATVVFFAYDQIAQMVYSMITFIEVVDIRQYTFYLFAAYGIIGGLFGIMGGVISIGRYLKKEGENAVI